MCGIISYYGKPEQIIDILMSGLKRLEYRGYDSAGIALVNQKGEVTNIKSLGKIINLEQKLNSTYPNQQFESKIGIAHTRWATHGIPSEENAHPHSSMDGKIWLVHNGIIENYKELKQDLIDQGIIFKSQTDTEVIANLLAINYDGDLTKTIRKCAPKIQGAFAIAVFCIDEPDRLVAVKMSAPLILGVLPEEFLIASDVSAVISKTREVIYLEDGEMVDITKNGYQISDFLVGNSTFRDTQTVDWTDEQASKEGYEHFLLKEIMQQPSAVQDSTRGRLLIEEGNVKFGGLIDVQDKIKQVEKVILLGVGTSYYACKLAELYFEEIAGITTKAEMSPEFRYKNNLVDEKTWVIAVSQSGETADTIAALQEAKQKGALVTGIVNTVGSTISRTTDAGVYNHIGPEISVASTKAFTSQCLLLLMHAVFLGRFRQLSLTQGKSIIQEIESLPQKITKVLELNNEIKTLAGKYHQYPNLIYVGRKYNYPIALEGALKIKEISYIHAEGLSGGELKHGFIALIEDHFPTVALVTKDSVYDKMVSNLEEIKARSGKILAVATLGDKNISELTSDVVYVPQTTEELQPLLNNIVLQLFAYHCSHLNNLDVDKPRNLAKSVTVE